MLVGMSLYSKSSSPKEAQGMFQNILLAEYHRTSHETPLTKRFILFVNLQNKFGRGKDCVNNLSEHKLVLLTLALMCACQGKTTLSNY